VSFTEWLPKTACKGGGGLFPDCGGFRKTVQNASQGAAEGRHRRTVRRGKKPTKRAGVNKHRRQVKDRGATKKPAAEKTFESRPQTIKESPAKRLQGQNYANGQFYHTEGREKGQYSAMGRRPETRRRLLLQWNPVIRNQGKQNKWPGQT